MGILMDRDLFDVLVDLHHRLNTYGNTVENTSVIERYSFMVKHSEYGKNCGYARKYRDMFVEHDYEDIRKLIMEAADMFKAIDSPEEYCKERDTINAKDSEDES